MRLFTGDVLHLVEGPRNGDVWTAGADGSLRLLNAERTWQEHGVATAHASRVSALAAVRSGEDVVTAGRGGGVAWWRYDGHGIAKVACAEPPSPATCAAAGPTPHAVLTGHRDGTVRAWDVGSDCGLVQRAEPLATLQAPVRCLAVASTGVVIAGLQNGTAVAAACV